MIPTFDTSFLKHDRGPERARYGAVWEVSELEELKQAFLKGVRLKGLCEALERRDDLSLILPKSSRLKSERSGVGARPRRLFQGFGHSQNADRAGSAVIVTEDTMSLSNAVVVAGFFALPSFTLTKRISMMLCMVCPM